MLLLRSRARMPIWRVGGATAAVTVMAALTAAAIVGLPRLAGAAPVAHRHGVATLAVALDGSALQLMLEAPLDVVVGFEHAPHTAAQRDAATKALTLLHDGAALFGPDAAARCRLREAVVAAPVLQVKSGIAAKSADAVEHADLDASYRFECAEPARLRSIELPIFDALRRLERVEVQIAVPAGQRKAVIERGARRLSLPQ